jgi:carbamoyltransferase
MDKLIFGISAFGHDASVSVVRGDKVLFAAHSERYSKIKNDHLLNEEILEESLSFGDPDLVCYYEKPFLKKARVSLFGGNYTEYEKYFSGVRTLKFGHHRSHAALGYFSSNSYNATIVVVDAIGEFETTSIWAGRDNSLKKVYSNSYPFSFGLFYSAFTTAIGLRPNEEEYILMGMAGYGDKEKYFAKIDNLFPRYDKQRMNFHYGVDLPSLGINPADKFDIAAAVQAVYEKRISELCVVAQFLTHSENDLVIAGGCALNATANTQLFDIAENVIVSPNPGDAGSSLGAILAYKKSHVPFENPFLGHDLGSKYPVKSIMDSLKTKKIAAVASGRAEFGPRALGNRSIFADPRTKGIKDTVNRYKQREEFRPFGCVVLEEDAKDWFDIKAPSPFMKFTFKCKKPKEIPSVVHIDGTSRVQTVNRRQHPGLYGLLQSWKEYSGVPILLNTSLNIKGQPLLNDKLDVALWNHTNSDLKICK